MVHWEESRRVQQTRGGREGPKKEGRDGREIEGTADGCINKKKTKKRDTFAAQTSDKDDGKEVRGQRR